MILLVDCQGRLDQFLSTKLNDLSRSKIKQLILDSDVLVNGQSAKPSQKLKGGEKITIKVPPPEPTDLVPEKIELDIIYKDDDLIVVNKPAGMVVHPAKGNNSGTLVHALLYEFPVLAQADSFQRPGIVHRIDKGTSGLLLVARHELALRRLQAQFMIHSVERIYLVVVQGTPRFLEGRIETNLGRHPRDRLKFASGTEGKIAITNWRTIQTGSVSLLKCKLETGRTHQIRVHLSESGHPVIGDPLYKKLNVIDEGLDHQLLHAATLAFEHPINGKRFKFECPPPDDFVAFCQKHNLNVPNVVSW